MYKYIVLLILLIAGCANPVYQIIKDPPKTEGDYLNIWRKLDLEEQQQVCQVGMSYCGEVSGSQIHIEAAGDGATEARVVFYDIKRDEVHENTVSLPWKKDLGTIACGQWGYVAIGAKGKHVHFTVYSTVNNITSQLAAVSAFGDAGASAQYIAPCPWSY
jgi:hypothetical protein